MYLLEVSIDMGGKYSCDEITEKLNSIVGRHSDGSNTNFNYRDMDWSFKKFEQADNFAKRIKRTKLPILELRVVKDYIN